MNIFEDLVLELKEANLLEETFIDKPVGPDVSGELDLDVLSSDELLGSDEPSTGDAPALNQTAGDLNGSWDDNAAEDAADEVFEIELNEPVPLTAPNTVESADLKLAGDEQTIEIRKPNSAREFFKKRAVAEMSSLRMVDAILSAIEREHLKILPLSYDDLEATKALDAFLRVAEQEKGDEHKQAEFNLLQETEQWCSALANRDKNISIGHLRTYCENCRPMLSSQAMLALARFYRNLPYSETIRGKFDFVITRLFSKAGVDERRELLFNRKEIYGHIKTLYADWSSIPLYSVDEDDSDIVLAALSFEEMAVEAETAHSFDELIKRDFFGRLRLFKESIAEMFFAPAVTAAAIDANVRIGNVYVRLINRERHRVDVDTIHSKYAVLDDQTVSEAVGRSLGLMEILRIPIEDIPFEEYADENNVLNEQNFHTSRPFISRPEVKPDQPVKKIGRLKSLIKERILEVNRFLLIGSLIVIALSAGFYVWVNYYAEPSVPTAGVKKLSFQDSDLGQFVKVAKLSGDTLYIVTQPTFESLPKDRKLEIMQSFYDEGNGHSWAKVVVMDDTGRTVGFSSATRNELYQKDANGS